jgi:hypothetical protein
VYLRAAIVSFSDEVRSLMGASLPVIRLIHADAG